MNLRRKWVKNNASYFEHGTLLTLTLRLDFLNFAIFKYQLHIKKDFSKRIYPFHVKLSQLLLTLKCHVVNIKKCR